jgi:NMD protein affecting ribosome stability and mRNA decay
MEKCVECGRDLEGQFVDKDRRLCDNCYDGIAEKDLINEGLGSPDVEDDNSADE